MTFKNQETGSIFTIKQIQTMINQVVGRGFGLTEWEIKFIASLDEQFSKKNFLSHKQLIILERLYTEKVK